MSTRGKRKWLLEKLELAGRAFTCEVRGCQAIEHFDIHHIWPQVVVQGVTSNVDDVSNLAFLCRQHHALVERFYFWARRKLAPELCREIVELSLEFAAGSVPALLVPVVKARQVALWAALNALEPCQNPLWWQATFAKAKTWAASVEPVRPMTTANAITSLPWFRTKRMPEGVFQGDLSVQVA